MLSQLLPTSMFLWLIGPNYHTLFAVAFEC